MPGLTASTSLILAAQSFLNKISPEQDFWRMVKARPIGNKRRGHSSVRCPYGKRHPIQIASRGSAGLENETSTSRADGILSVMLAQFDLRHDALMRLDQ